ncbi:MAG: serine hydrolase domain-containing protein, partial [Gemmatimonadota bacterium]
VTVVRGPDTLVHDAWGFADLELEVAARPDHVFRIGSVTKQFTAAAIMREVEAGRIELDAPITRYLPDLELSRAIAVRDSTGELVDTREMTEALTVTVRQLLHHTSGIRSYTSLPWEEWARNFEMPREDLVALFTAEPFDFEPGTEWRYDNSGYFLLGMILEAVSGQSYEEYVTEHLFQPLGLERTHYCRNGPLVPGRVEGYDLGPDGALANDEILDMRWPYAAGSLCASTGDLVRWSRALHGGEVVSPGSYQAMVEPAVLPDGESTGYGFGLGVGDFHGHPFIAHGGGINGFVSYLAYFPEEDAHIAVVVNTGGPGADRIYQALARELLGVEPPTDVPLAAEDRARYVGTYDLGSLQVRIWDEDGRMMAQATGQSSFRLLHQGDHTFVNDGAGIRIVFEMEDGRAVAFVLHQGGREIRAPRVEGGG